jgi:UPF0755 protein
VNDIRPPKKPSAPQAPPQPLVVDTPTTEEPVSTEAPEESSAVDDVRPSKLKRLFKYGALIAGALIILAVVAAGVWYQLSLRPAAASGEARVRIKVESGSSPREIASLLKQKNLIRSSLAFDVYTRLSGTRSKLQAGTYNLSPADTTNKIVDALVSGKTDLVSITFLPGATLAENRKALIDAGYTQQEVDTALGKTYSHPLFADKPASADLEGYIYGETYQFESTATVEQILGQTFDEYYKVIQVNDLVAKFNTQGLNLYQGITLASIIQREVATPSDMAQVAQVFLKRRAQDMPLGSDVTYQYIADKTGVPRDPGLDSPYNTRRYAGLPPGPISAPGLSALKAVGSPAAGNYLYFLSGDDDKTYFATTNEEHEANISAHCQVKCATP